MGRWRGNKENWGRWGGNKEKLGDKEEIRRTGGKWGGNNEKWGRRGGNKEKWGRWGGNKELRRWRGSDQHQKLEMRKLGGKSWIGFIKLYKYIELLGGIGALTFLFEY